MKKTIIITGIILFTLLIAVLGISIYKFLDVQIPPITNPGTNTGSISSGSNNTGDIITGSITNNHTKILLNSPIDGINGDILSEISFPKIKINKKINNIKISFDITFTNSFKSKFQGYIKNVDGYFFAFKFFLGNKDNGGFIDVFRNKNDGVANSKKHNLYGAKLGQEISDGTQWIIGNEVKIAQPAGIYGFTHAYPTTYINSQIGKTIYIGGHLSSVKEMKGRNFTKINQITIKYEGDEDAIEVVK